MKKHLKKIIATLIAFMFVVVLGVLFTGGAILDVWFDAPTLVNPNR